MSKHKRACKKYKEWLQDEKGYLSCESCNQVNKTFYSVHHIFSAGRYPKHKHLHDFRNLIFLCGDCHKDAHASRLDLSKEIEERRLKELFL
jgi:5-methylcytosine-specific restriction endonuclease McrA